jgi:carbamoyl-phosphate synthase/aspartate carbamoyltransferase/dihydroorotase
MMRLPGLIDPHVHMREPGATHKEDWSSGTAAALAGGFTQILAMPNTQPPVLNADSLDQVYALAQDKAYCDYAQYLGASADNPHAAARSADRSAGLKLYLDQTYGPLQLESMTDWIAHFKTWPVHRPLVAHAEGRTLAAAILISALTNRALHIAHVATKEEIILIRSAKEKGFKITCEVTPHHLFLTQEDLPEGIREVRPRLGTQKDCDALWENLAVIDCFATDHAPHTWQEKTGANPPPGFPGLETALPLFLTAVQEGKLTMEDLVSRMSDNVRRIFNIPTQPETWIEVDMGVSYEISRKNLQTKASWTPFEGRKVHGALRKVIMRGQTVFEDGKILTTPGTGQCIRS